jgi:hypothetical protein
LIPGADQHAGAGVDASLRDGLPNPEASARNEDTDSLKCHAHCKRPVDWLGETCLTPTTPNAGLATNEALKGMSFDRMNYESFA